MKLSLNLKLVDLVNLKHTFASKAGLVLNIPVPLLYEIVAVVRQ